VTEKINEIHGIANAQKIGNSGDDNQSVIVTDDNGFVLLSLSRASFAAGMTPKQARIVADMLNMAADRAEINLK